MLTAIKQAVRNFVDDESGLTIVEYAVAGGLITLGVVAAFTALGGAVAVRIDALCDAVKGSACS